MLMIPKVFGRQKVAHCVQILPPGFWQVAGLSIHRMHSPLVQKSHKPMNISDVHEVAARQPFST